MEVKINREIRNYTESIYFGLSLRQFIYTMLAIVSCLFIYFIFRNTFNIEIISWICIIIAVPFIFLGFFKYNGMNAEELIKAIIKSKILIKRDLVFDTRNNYIKERDDENKNI